MLKVRPLVVGVPAAAETKHPAMSTRKALYRLLFIDKRKKVYLYAFNMSIYLGSLTLGKMPDARWARKLKNKPERMGLAVLWSFMSPPAAEWYKKEGDHCFSQFYLNGKKSSSYPMRVTDIQFSWVFLNEKECASEGKEKFLVGPLSLCCLCLKAMGEHEILLILFSVHGLRLRLSP